MTFRELLSASTVINALLALTILASQGAQACTKDDVDMINITVTVPETIVQRDVPVGSVLYTQTYSTNVDINQRFAEPCENSIGSYSFIGGAAVSGYEHTYSTNVPGVGISVQTGDSYFFENPAHQITWSGGWQWSYWGIKYTIILTKTAPTTGSGDIGASKAIMSLPGVTPDPETINITGGEIKTLACSIQTKNIEFHMPDIPVNELGNTQGTTSASTDSQNLGLDCDPGANINVTFSGQQNPDVSDTSVLALNQGQSPVAQGVGVQILYDNLPLKLNERIVLKKSEGGQESFPLTARYINTKGQVTPGNANASATLTLTYQ